MAMDIDATLTNRDNSKGINLRGVGNWKFGRVQPAIALPIVNAKPQNNVLFRFTGQTETIGFTFSILDTGVRVDNPHHTSEVKTKNEQISYLRNQIYTEDFDVDWTLLDNIYFTSGIQGVITNLTIDSVAGNPQKAVGSITFMRGRIGAL